MAQRTFPLVRTADDLGLLPDDGNRYELIDGVLFVSAAPLIRHQLAQSELLERLFPYVRSVGMRALSAPTAVRASRWTEVQPDILVVSSVPAGELVRHVPMPVVTLAVEILSPATADRDRGLKRQTYLANGVGEYWVVDLEVRAVDVWRDAVAPVARQQHTLIWHPVAAQPALTLDLTACFAAVFDA